VLNIFFQNSMVYYLFFYFFIIFNILFSISGEIGKKDYSNPKRVKKNK